MINTIATFEGRIAKVCGPARSGKTEALVQRCVSLLKEGVDPSSILVETTSAFAAQAFRRRLADALGADGALADAVTIARTLDVCARVLSRPEACAFTGRTPRLLNGAEYNFYLEDMKTLGMPLRRLRKMLDFFYRQWSGLVPESEWMGTEEETVRDHAIRVLSLRGAMLAQEAPMLCATFLKSAEGESFRQQYDYVLCDDYQNLSAAEQTCLCLLAGKQLIVAGNPNQTVTLGTNYPHAEGFVQFDALRHGVETFHLDKSYGNRPTLALAGALTAHGDMDASIKAETTEGPDTEIAFVKWNTPEDEMNGITKYLRVLVDKEDDPRECKTCILVPNKRWARMVERIMKRRGFSVSASGACAGIGGDPRESDRAKGLVAYTKLNLLACPTDMTAWRSWCGFDNPLTNSDAWNNLMDWADRQGLSLYEALEQACAAETEPFLRANALTARFREGREFIEKNARRKGFTLLRAIGAEGLPEFEDTAAMLEGDEDAARMYEIARAYATDAQWPEDLHTVHVCTFDAMTGCEYDHVYALGMVDGFMPRRDAFETVSTDEDRERVMNAERRSFYNAISKARKTLLVSTFSKSQLELAERTKMQVVRVKSENGERMAILRPSIFMTEAGDACPTTLGGQSLLSKYGLN